MTIIRESTADRQAIATRGHRISVRPVLDGSLDGSYSPDLLFEFLFGVLIGLDNGLAGSAQIVKLAQVMRHVRQDFSDGCPEGRLGIGDHCHDWDGKRAF